MLTRLGGLVIKFKVTHCNTSSIIRTLKTLENVSSKSLTLITQETAQHSKPSTSGYVSKLNAGLKHLDLDTFENLRELNALKSSLKEAVMDIMFHLKATQNAEAHKYLATQNNLNLLIQNCKNIFVIQALVKFFIAEKNIFSIEGPYSALDQNKFEWIIKNADEMAKIFNLATFDFDRLKKDFPTRCIINLLRDCDQANIPLGTLTVRLKSHIEKDGKSFSLLRSELREYIEKTKAELIAEETASKSLFSRIINFR